MISGFLIQFGSFAIGLQNFGRPEFNSSSLFERISYSSLRSLKSDLSETRFVITVLKQIARRCHFRYLLESVSSSKSQHCRLRNPEV